jgi:hypothetical protein
MPKEYKAPAKVEYKSPVKKRKAFGIARNGGNWVMIELTYSHPEHELLEYKESEPDIKAVATERYRIASAKNWQEVEADL